MTRVFRKVRIDGNSFIQFWCDPCGESYLVAVPFASTDSGMCVFCENEVKQLENLYGEVQ